MRGLRQAAWQVVVVAMVLPGSAAVAADGTADLQGLWIQRVPGPAGRMLTGSLFRVSLSARGELTAKVEDTSLADSLGDPPNRVSAVTFDGRELTVQAAIGRGPMFRYVLRRVDANTLEGHSYQGKRRGKANRWVRLRPAQLRKEYLDAKARLEADRKECLRQLALVAKHKAERERLAKGVRDVSGTDRRIKGTSFDAAVTTGFIGRQKEAELRLARIKERLKGVTERLAQLGE